MKHIISLRVRAHYFYVISSFSLWWRSIKFRLSKLLISFMNENMLYLFMPSLWQNINDHTFPIVSSYLCTMLTNICQRIFNSEKYYQFTGDSYWMQKISHDELIHLKVRERRRTNNISSHSTHTKNGLDFQNFRCVFPFLIPYGVNLYLCVYSFFNWKWFIV